MGYEANYIIRRGGRTRIFHSLWGALSLAQDIFWGPEETTRYIRSLQDADGLLARDSCSGAALVDWDARRLTWFETGHLDQEPLERRIYSRLLQQMWPNWQIQYAAEGILTIASELGLDHAAISRREIKAAEDGAQVEDRRWLTEDAEWLRSVGRAGRQDLDANAQASLAAVVARLLDEDRCDLRILVDSIHRASRRANAGCGCLAMLVMLLSVAVAAWVRTTPAIVVCVLVALGVLIPATLIRRRSASAVALMEDLEAAPVAAGPSLPKKRSVLDQVLGRLGYPTINRLEQAGLLVSPAESPILDEELPDRFGPLRPVRADEIAGVAFYRMRLSRMRFRELRRGATLWQACLLKFLTPLGWGAEVIIPVSRPERLILLEWKDVPRHVQRRLEPWMKQAAESGFTTALRYTLPMLGRQEAFGMVLADADGLILASLMYARVRVRMSTEDDEYSDEELLEASLLSVLPNNRLLITGTRTAELDPMPGHAVQICEDADWPTLRAAHRRRMETLAHSGLQRVTAADLPALVLRWNQEEIDHRVARGVYERMSREDIDRFADEG